MDAVEIKAKVLSELGATQFAIRNGVVEYLDGNAVEPSESDIDAQVALEEVLEARKNSYASWRDQLDMQYKDLLNDTTTWKDHIAKVKSDNPKP